MSQTISGQRILVTGATGYVGSFLVPRLCENNEVHALARDGGAASRVLGLSLDRVHSSVDGAGAILKTFEMIQPTVVFHLATHYERRDDINKMAAMVDANIRFGSFVLAAASSIEQCQVVVAGSHFQFGEENGRPANFYAATKNALCEIARYLQDAQGLQWIQPVLFDVYGPSDPRAKLITVVIERILAGEPISLPDPEPLHHFVYIDDVVDALIASAAELRSDRSRVGADVFVTSDELITPAAAVAAVAAVVGQPARLDSTPYSLPEGSIMVPVAGPRPQGWEPRIALSDGVRAVLDGAVAG